MAKNRKPAVLPLSFRDVKKSEYKLFFSYFKPHKWLFFFVIAAALAFGVGCLGRNRKIGFGWAFGISLINVVIGLIVVLCSKKKTPNELEKKN